MRRLVIDAILSGVLSSCLIVLQNREWQPPASDFIASCNPIIWGAFTGVFFALISIFVWNVFSRPQIVLARLFEIAGILVVAETLALLFYVLRHRAEDLGTVIGFGVMFTLFPALIASLGSFLLLAFLGWLVSASTR